MSQNESENQTLLSPEPTPPAPPQQPPTPTQKVLKSEPRKFSLFCRISSKIFYIIFSLSLVVLFFTLGMKQPKKNWEIEKSIMRPNLIEPAREFLSFASKRYLNLPNSDSHSLFDQFDISMRKYGIQLKRHDFHIEGQPAWNVYGLLRSRKEASQRCFMFAFDRTNPFELLIADAFIDQFFSKNTNVGISVVLIGFDGRFKEYNLSVKKFFEVHFSENQFFDECNFTRDGVSLLVEKGKKSANKIAYFPCLITRRKRGHIL